MRRGWQEMRTKSVVCHLLSLEKMASHRSGSGILPISSRMCWEAEFEADSTCPPAFQSVARMDLSLLGQWRCSPVLPFQQNTDGGKGIGIFESPPYVSEACQKGLRSCVGVRRRDEFHDGKARGHFFEGIWSKAPSSQVGLYSEDSHRLSGAHRGALYVPYLARKSTFSGPIFGNTGSSEFGGVRYMGSSKAGDRASEHGVRMPIPKAEGSQESLEAEKRGQFLDNAKQDIAARIRDAEGPFRDSVELGESTDDATSKLQFGTREPGRSTEEAVEEAHEALLQKSDITDGGPKVQENRTQGNEEAFTVRDHDASNPHADIASEVWSAKEHQGTSHFLDDSDKEESVTGTDSSRAS